MRCYRLVMQLLCSGLVIAGCSRDEPLVGDYKLYDLDGSNQSIIGNNGMIAVSNVSALTVDDPLIFVEIGGDVQRQNCSYKLIDVAEHSMIVLSVGSARRREAIVAIAARPRGVMSSRSCAVRP